MTQDNGACPSGTGLSQQAAEPEVSALRASIPSAGALPNITYVSCPLCYGTRETDFGPCLTCAEPDIARVRWMLPRLSAEQIDFLRAFEHTLAKQPVTDSEYSALRCEFFVEDSDGEYDEEYGHWLIPNSRHWFASAEFQSGPCGNNAFVRYNSNGLLLRDCLMCGATANVPHLYPPRHAQAMSAGTAETEGLGAKPASAVGSADAPPTSQDH